MTPFSFAQSKDVGLVVAAGGFEKRATAFLARVRRGKVRAEAGILLRYETQRLDNEPNFLLNRDFLQTLMPKGIFVQVAQVSADSPIQSCSEIKAKIDQVAAGLKNRCALVDISGMTHLWALSAIHECISAGLRTEVIYTEARSYYPLRPEWRKLRKALASKDDEAVYQSLQSASLKAVHILSEFAGNFRPGRLTCLVIFAGYEPNRVQGLVDDYSPGRLVVLFGRPPRPNLQWRMELSKDLHREFLQTWYKREAEVSTGDVASILDTLEQEYSVIGEHFDLAVAPHCSKMQGVASYLFWRRHPEVQLVFTSPVKFHRDRYSEGQGKTYVLTIDA
jgi:hypothetical protein